MQRQVMIPLFHSQDYGGAIEAGALELVKAIYESTEKEPLQDTPWIPPSSHETGFCVDHAHLQQEDDYGDQGDDTDDCSDEERGRKFLFYFFFSALWVLLQSCFA